MVKIIINLLYIKFIIKLPFNIIFYRILKLLNLKKNYLKLIRRKFIINEALSLYKITNLKNFNIHHLFDNIYDEFIFFESNQIYFQIGNKQEKINIFSNTLNKKNYLFPYLFWYLNWINNQPQNFIKLFNLIKSAEGIALEPHPISNRIINIVSLLSTTNIIDENLYNEIAKFIIKDFNTLLINTEEDVGGNHLVDNYIAILLVSSILKNEICIKYFEKKLFNLINNSIKFKENNPGYIKLIYRKLKLLELYLGENRTINQFIKILEVNMQEFGIFSYNDCYSNTRIPMLLNNINYLKDSSFRWSSINNNISIFFAMNVQSSHGFNGHDHDCNSSIYISSSNKQVIGGKGTICYSYDKRRIINKSFLMSPTLRYYNIFNQFTLNCFRNISLNNIIFDSNLDINNKIFSCVIIQKNKKIILNARYSESDFCITFTTSDIIEFNFYTQFNVECIGSIVLIGPIKIYNVKLIKICKTKIYKSLYRNVDGLRIKLRVDKGKFKIETSS